MVTQPTGASVAADRADQKRVICSYNRDAGRNTAAFEIKAYNHYSSPSDTFLRQGYFMTITNISDNGANGSIVVGNPRIDSLNYHVSGSYDGAVNDQFSRNATCPLGMTVERATAETPCASGVGMERRETITVKAKYNCPSLRSTIVNNSDVRIEDGFLFCEVSKTTGCVGGGQPPIPR
jgi:hypothetical protein